MSFSVLLLTSLWLTQAGAAARIPEATRKPLHQVVDLAIGESQEVVVGGSKKVSLKLLDVQETSEEVCAAVNVARVKVAVGGKAIWLGVGTYNLPQTVGGVQIDSPVSKGVYRNTEADQWGLVKDARLRVWPAGSPLVEPGTLVHPLKQRWSAAGTWMVNEPVLEWFPKGKIYYHSGMDIGGAEGITEIVAPVTGTVVVAGKEIAPGVDFDAFIPGYDPRKYDHDQVWIVDDRGWYHGSVHLVRVDVHAGQAVEMGQMIGLLGKEGGSGGWSHLHYEIRSRQPSGKWGSEAGYALIQDAYRRQFAPPLIAVAGPLHHEFIRAGTTTTLDARLSGSFAGRLVRTEWKFTDGATASGPVVKHTYKSPGTYNEILKLVDSKGNVDYDFHAVQVIAAGAKGRDDLPPRVHASYAPTMGIEPGQPVTFKVRTFYTAAGEETWDFGDGTEAAKTKSGENYVETVHTYAKAGQYIVTVERTGHLGTKGTCHLRVWVGK